MKRFGKPSTIRQRYRSMYNVSILISDDVVAVISESLPEAVTPGSPLLHPVLGCQHGAVPHSEVTEPSPLSDLRGIVPGRVMDGKL